MNSTLYQRESLGYLLKIIKWEADWPYPFPALIVVSPHIIDTIRDLLHKPHKNTPEYAPEYAPIYESGITNYYDHIRGVVLLTCTKFEIDEMRIYAKWRHAYMDLMNSLSDSDLVVIKGYIAKYES